MTSIWQTAINNGMSSSAISNAQASISANIASLQAQLRSINQNAALRSQSRAVDFLIVGIPPLEIVPTFSYQANGNSQQLALLKSLTAQFNSQLSSLANSFRGEVPKGGKVFFYDLAALVSSIELINQNPNVH